MKYLLSTLLLLLTHLAVAQNNSKSQLEIMPFIRHDSYPGFSYHVADRAPSDYLEMKGTSWGTNINYKFLLGRNLRVKAGLGYYRYTFNELDRKYMLYNSTSRPIGGFVSPIYINFFTDKYWYNCATINVGLEKAIPLSRNFQIITGINFSNYFTYSQQYHITYKGENGPPQDWKQKDKRHFGYSGSLQIGLTKSIGQYSFGPHLLLPVYDTWRKDDVFGETANENETRSKWFRGLGLGISINKNL